MSRKLVLVGVGKWGINYLKTLKDSKDFKITAAVSSKSSEEILKLSSYATESFPLTEINNLPSDIDGFIVATPPEGREEIIDACLKYKVPILSEKPLTLQSEKTEHLITKAQSGSITLRENFIHLYSEAYQEIHNNIDQTKNILIESFGGNNGPFRDYSPLVDYGPHDISMCLNIFKSYPEKIDVELFNYVDDYKFSCDIKLSFRDQGHCHIRTGNTFEDKQRFFKLINGDNTWVYDDLSAERLTLNGKGVALEGISPLQKSVNSLMGLENSYNPKDLDWLSINTMKLIEEIQSKLF